MLPETVASGRSEEGDISTANPLETGPITNEATKYHRKGSFIEAHHLASEK
jgi:hypothetical protein